MDAWSMQDRSELDMIGFFFFLYFEYFAKIKSHLQFYCEITRYKMTFHAIEKEE